MVRYTRARFIEEAVIPFGLRQDEARERILSFLN